MANNTKTKLKEILSSIDESVLSFNKDEYWMYRNIYEFIEDYALSNNLLNTLIALNVVRGLHDGAHRKLTIKKDGVDYRYPYVVHPLLVTRMLLDMHINLNKDEEDILYASALCHDLLEDIKFEKGGLELVEDYHLDSRIVDIVRLMTKRYDFTPEEEKAFFDQIAANKFSALIKLSDRGNNVEDSYNMSVWKIHEYIDETNKFFIPIDYHAKRSFPELYPYLEILEDKIVSLTSLAMTLVDRYNDEEKELRLRLENLKLENKYLNEELERLRNEGEEHD